MRECSLGGVGKDETRVAGHVDRLAVHGDDRAVAQLCEDLALFAYPVVAGGVSCDLQDELLGVGIANQQSDGGRAAAEALDDLEPRDDVTRLCGERMDFLGLVRLLWLGDLLLDERDPVDEVRDRRRPVVASPAVASRTRAERYSPAPSRIAETSSAPSRWRRSVSAASDVAGGCPVKT
jgi:hypothetical protein